MGSWGPGSFDNDGALDFVIDLCKGHSFDRVTSTLCRVANSTKPDIDVDFLKEKAIAAAEILAAAGGLPSPELPEDVEAWLADRNVPITAEMLEYGLKAIDRVEAHWEALRAYWCAPSRLDEYFILMEHYWAANGQSYERNLKGVYASFEEAFETFHNLQARLLTLQTRLDAGGVTMDHE